MNSWRYHGTKILGALGTLLGILAMSLTPEQLVALLGQRGPGALLLAGGVLTWIRGFQNNGTLRGGPPNASPTSSAPAPSDSSVKAHWLVTILCALFVFTTVGALMTGCSTLSPTQRIAAQVGIQYATAKFIEREPEAERGARAQKIIAAVDTLKSVITDKTATVDTLSSYALELVARSNLSPADRVLANSLVAAVVEELRARVQRGFLKEEEKMTITGVLDGIAAAAQSYAPIVRTPLA